MRQAIEIDIKHQFVPCMVIKDDILLNLLTADMIPDGKDFSHVSVEEFDGQKWWKVVGCHEMPNRERLLEPGDAIIYRREQKSRDEFMIIDSFDFDSDVAARSCFSIRPDFKTECISGDAPLFKYYRMAEYNDIINYFNTWNFCHRRDSHAWHIFHRMLEKYPKYRRYVPPEPRPRYMI